jgi:hypothetical protein
VSVATANGVKTMLQVATPSNNFITLIAWGYSIDVASAGIMTVELLQTDVGATIVQHVASGIQPLDPGTPASSMDISGTGKTGYTASAEGSITATRVLDAQKHSIAAAGHADLSYSYQFMPDERPIVPISKFLRVRATATTTTPTMLCWVVWDE